MATAQTITCKHKVSNFTFENHNVFDSSSLSDNSHDLEVTAHRANRRAARWVWATGGVASLASGCLIMSLVGTAMTPVEEVARQLAPHESAELVAAAYPLLWPAATSLSITGLGPGLAQLYLGFAICRGARKRTNVAAALAIVQAVLVALLLVNLLLQAVQIGNPVAFSASVLVVGTPLALLIGSARAVLRARRLQKIATEIQVDPWK